MPDEGSLDAARNRIQAAFDANLFRDAGSSIVEDLSAHFERIQASREKVLNWHDPAPNVEYARQIMRGDAGDGKPASTSERALQLVRTMLARGHNLHDPRYIGHQVPAPVPVAGLFDAVGAATNQVMAIYEMGPWATAVERALVEELGSVIGWPDGTFAGLATHGGSLANLTALATARNVRLGDCWEQGVRPEDDAVTVVHSDAHYSVVRSVGVLGLGTSSLIRAELDDLRRIDPQRLDDLLGRLRQKKRTVVAVVACACATPIGAFDPLNDVAEVCSRHGVWLHVDAAHGGAALFSQRHRGLLSGIDRADSLVWDAHKMLFVPALCAFVFYRDKQHRFETFRQDAPYLFDPSAPGMAEYDSGLSTVECTKRAAAYGLWGTWSLFGPKLFGDMVDVTFEVAREFHAMLSDASDFQPLHVPECNIVAFRYVPRELHDADPDAIGRLQHDVRRALVRSGEFYIVQTTLDGVGALRVTVCNPLTNADHMAGLLEAIRRHARPLVAEMSSSK